MVKMSSSIVVMVVCGLCSLTTNMGPFQDDNVRVVALRLKVRARWWGIVAAMVGGTGVAENLTGEVFSRNDTSAIGNHTRGALSPTGNTTPDATGAPSDTIVTGEPSDTTIPDATIVSGEPSDTPSENPENQTGEESHQTGGETGGETGDEESQAGETGGEEYHLFFDPLFYATAMVEACVAGAAGYVFGVAHQKLSKAEGIEQSLNRLLAASEEHTEAHELAGVKLNSVMDRVFRTGVKNDPARFSPHLPLVDPHSRTPTEDHPFFRAVADLTKALNEPHPSPSLIDYFTRQQEARVPTGRDAHQVTLSPTSETVYSV